MLPLAEKNIEALLAMCPGGILRVKLREAARRLGCRPETVSLQLTRLRLRASGRKVFYDEKFALLRSFIRPDGSIAMSVTQLTRRFECSALTVGRIVAKERVARRATRQDAARSVEGGEGLAGRCPTSARIERVKLVACG